MEDSERQRIGGLSQNQSAAVTGNGGTSSNHQEHAGEIYWARIPLGGGSYAKIITNCDLRRSQAKVIIKVLAAMLEDEPND